VFWAFVYNVIAIPIAAGVLYPFTGYLLNPMIAGAAMAFLPFNGNPKNLASRVVNPERIAGCKWQDTR
jgi:hypothetical protein